MRLKNYTTHDINIVVDGNSIILPSEGFARTSEANAMLVSVAEINGHKIPIVKRVFGETTGLPDKEEGVMLIVSSVVMLACPDRDDLVVPNTIRDQKGQIVGAHSFGVRA